MEKLIDARQAAEFLRCSRQMVYIWSERGILPSYKVGSLRRFAVEDLRQWLAARREGQVPA